MSFIKSDAPRTLLSFIWATAVMLTIFFAVIISSFFVLKHYYPVSADDATVLPATANCDSTKNESRVAINNFPGDTAITAAYPKAKNDYQHGPVEEALGGDYQCSMICVPGIDQKRPVSDPANILVIKSYLSGATIGGKPILADVPNGVSFVGTVKLAIAQTDLKLKQEQLDQLKRIVIIPYSKNICAGNPGGKGGRVPYAEIVTKDKQVVKEEEPNNTKDQANIAQAQQKAAAEQADAVAPVPIAGPADKNKVSAPVAAAQAGTVKSEPTEREIAKARTNLNECVYKSLNLYNKINGQTTAWKDAEIKYDDMNLYYKTVTALTQRRKTTQDPIGDLAKCKKLLATLDKVDNTVTNYTTRQKRSDSQFDPWAEDNSQRNQNTPYGQAIVDNEKQVAIYRAWEKEVYAFWGQPAKKVVNLGGLYGWTVTSNKGAFNPPIFATWVKGEQQSEKFWSLHVYNRDYKYDYGKRKWVGYDKKNHYSGKNRLTTIDTGYPDHMPAPFQYPKYMINDILD